MTLPHKTLPDEVEQRVRDYFAALLPPHAAQAALADVLKRLPLNASPSAVFVAAHTALQARLRVRPEVEADVLVEEAGLSVSDAANVLGLRVRDVRGALDAAAAAAAALDRSLTGPAVGSGGAETSSADPERSSIGPAGGRGGGGASSVAREGSGVGRGGGGASSVAREGSGVGRRGGGASSATREGSRIEPVVGRGGGETSSVAREETRVEPAVAPGSGSVVPMTSDHDPVEQAVDLGSGTGSVGGDAFGQHVVIVVDEEVDAETLETVERSRAGAVLVLVLAVAIAVAALVVAAQGT